MEITERDLKKLYTWIDDIPLSRPKRNFARDFSDGVLMAEVLYYYFPRLVQLHNYSSAKGLRQKRCNWDTLNRKVLARLGVEVSHEEVEDIINCKPRVIEKLLKTTRNQLVRHEAMKHEASVSSSSRSSSTRVKTPDSTDDESLSFYEEGDDANNRLLVGDCSKLKTAASVDRLYNTRISQIPRAPSQQSMTPTPPPPPLLSESRPKSSFEICSNIEMDLMIKELQETNELLLAKINKLEELLRLKDKKIVSLSAKLNMPDHQFTTGVITPWLRGAIDLRS
eukprot:g1959.t1